MVRDKAVATVLIYWPAACLLRLVVVVYLSVTMVTVFPASGGCCISGCRLSDPSKVKLSLSSKQMFQMPLWIMDWSFFFFFIVKGQ